MSKKEKKVKEKKEKVPMAVETKQTWFKSATAIVCTLAICFATNSAVDKYSEALKTVGTNNGGNAVVADNGGDASYTDDTAIGGDVVADDIAAPVDDAAAADAGDTAAADDTAAAADTGDTAAASSSTGGNTATTASAGKSSAAKDPTQYSKAEVVNYYNKCLKESYAKKLKAKKTETITIVFDESSAGSLVTDFINGTILPKYAGTTEYDRDFTNGIHGEQKITEYASPYSLTADGAKTAKITKSGANYLITINVVAEKSTLETPPKYNTMCSHPLDLATVDISPATVTKADFTYPGTTLTATVDANGKVFATSIKQPLSGTGEGKLGIKISATLHGSFDQKVTYTYL